MRLFWWQQLPLLILIQLLEPSRTSRNLYAEASFVGSSQQPSSVIERNPCLRQRACLSCYKLKDPGVVSLPKYSIYHHLVQEFFLHIPQFIYKNEVLNRKISGEHQLRLMEIVVFQLSRLSKTVMITRGQKREKLQR